MTSCCAYRGLVGFLAFRPPTPQYKAWAPDLRWIPRLDGRPSIPIVCHSDPSASADSPVLLYSHGNAEDLAVASIRCLRIASLLRCHVVTYEYDGYGVLGTPGECSEEACYSAIQACYDYMVKSIDPTRIVLYGHSLGTGPTVELAHRLSQTSESLYAGCILQSPLESCMRVALPFSVPWLDMFVNSAKMSALTRPTLFIHGDSDPIISHTHTHSLAALVPDHLCTVHIINEGGHNDLETAHEREWKPMVESFLRELSK